MDEYPIGSFVKATFGPGFQTGHVVGITRTGKLKVRGFNGSGGYWQKNIRTLKPDDIAGLAVAPDRAPPAIEGAQRALQPVPVGRRRLEDLTDDMLVIDSTAR
jgi:hypothetical protein